MSLFKRFKKFGSYRAFVKCPNCNFGSEIKIPKGVSVADFVKGGRCECENCGVVSFPSEYTTEHFEKEKNKDINKNINVRAKLNKSYLDNLKDKKEVKWM